MRESTIYPFHYDLYLLYLLYLLYMGSEERDKGINKVIKDLERAEIQYELEREEMLKKAGPQRKPSSLEEVICLIGPAIPR